MEVQRRAVDRLTAEEVQAWQRLSDASAEPNPFFEPAMVVPAARHLARRPVELLSVEASGRWVAALPVLRRLRLGRYPGPSLAAWVHAQCFLGDPLMVAGAGEEVADALLAALDTPWLALPRMPLDGELAGALRLRGRTEVLRRETRAVRCGPAPAGTAILSSRGRSELRRRARRLAEALGAEPRVTVASGRDARAVEDFLALEHSGWKRASGTSVLSDPREAAFFREAASRLGERLRFFRLAAGERTAAIASAISSRRTHFLFKAAYDESLGRFSPGQALATAAIDALDGRIDSCAAPDSELVNSLLPHRREFGLLAVTRRNATGRAYAAVLRALAR